MELLGNIPGHILDDGDEPPTPCLIVAISEEYVTVARGDGTLTRLSYPWVTLDYRLVVDDGWYPLDEVELVNGEWRVVGGDVQGEGESG